MVWVWWIDVVSVRCCKRSQVSDRGRPLQAGPSMLSERLLVSFAPLHSHPTLERCNENGHKKTKKRLLFLWGAWGTADGRAGRGVLLHRCSSLQCQAAHMSGSLCP